MTEAQRKKIESLRDQLQDAVKSGQINGWLKKDHTQKDAMKTIDMLTDLIAKQPKEEKTEKPQDELPF